MATVHPKSGKAMRFPVVLVRWKDAFITSSGDEHTLEQLPTIRPAAPTVSVGWLVRRTREALFVAQDWSQGDGVSLDSWRNITVIPRTMVTSITILRRGAES